MSEKEVFVVIKFKSGVRIIPGVEMIEVFEDFDDAQEKLIEIERNSCGPLSDVFLHHKVKLHPSSKTPQKSVSDLQTISQKMQEKERSRKVKPLSNEDDDPLNPEWPFGFDVLGHPITMGEMVKDPDSAADPFYLSDYEGWQVVKARIKRYQNSWIELPGIGGIDRNVAMENVKNKTEFGKDIKNEMIVWLADQLSLAFDLAPRNLTDLPPDFFASLGSSEDDDRPFDDNERIG